jgi:hypothetical protein
MGKLRLLVGLALPLLGACDDSVSSKPILGTYAVMISSKSVPKSDTDILTIVAGTQGTLVLSFISGITTDPTAPNANGLHAVLGENGTLRLDRQPALIDHSTGWLNGTVVGDGKVQKGMIDLTLHFSPTDLPGDTSGGAADGGTATTLDYEIVGSKS